MPEICRFYGIVIKMYFADHAPPHIHARYAEWEAQLSLLPIEIIRGQLPRRARSLVFEWMAIHQEELLELWQHASRSQPLKRLDPLN